MTVNTFILIKKVSGIWIGSIILYLCLVAIMYMSTVQFGLDPKYLNALTTMTAYMVVFLFKMAFEILIFISAEKEQARKKHDDPKLRAVTYVAYLIPISIPIITELVAWTINFPFYLQIFLLL